MFIKYPKIRILGHRDNEGILTTPGKILIQEKIDGAQFGFFVENDILHFCSHNQNLTDSDQIEKTGLPKNWRAIEPILESWKRDPTQFNEKYYYYGESMQKHTIKYGDDIPGFIGYDIFEMESGKFLDYKIAKKEFEKIGLPFIHVIDEIEVNDNITLDYLKSLYQKSAYKEGSAEGIVIKRYDIGLMAKVICDNFKEKNNKTFDRTEQPKMFDDDKIVEAYATPARIEKIIYKLHDDGLEIDLPMMSILYKEVIQDFLDEEILEIYQNYKNINFKNLNGLVSKKCKIILKNLIMNRNL